MVSRGEKGRFMAETIGPSGDGKVTLENPVDHHHDDERQAHDHGGGVEESMVSRTGAPVEFVVGLVAIGNQLAISSSSSWMVFMARAMQARASL